SSQLRVYDLAGNPVKEIKLPDTGSINALIAGPESDDLLISFSSFLIPQTEYRLDLNTFETFEYTVQQTPDIPFDPDGFEVQQVWFESLDKTRIPMFLVHKKGIERDGNNATVVHGYGGFGVSLMPRFAAHVIPFLEAGGIYATVN